MQGSTGIEQKLTNLQARLMPDTELRTRGENKAPASPDLRGSLSSNSFASGSGGYPKRPQDLQVGSPSRTRRTCDYLPPNIMQQPRQVDSSEIDSKMNEIMRMNGMLHINNKLYQTEMKDLEHLGELGSGTCGQVVKMLHTPSQTVMAVKQMRRSGNGEENKRIIMDLDVVLKSYDCPNIVRCLGCFITESEVWICMELMATCFDRLLKRLHVSVPEPICGKITLSTVRALHYLKEKHGVIHRDVKPSNILLDERGNIKLCDFGISGRLVDSKARTKNAGCAAYMAPERIEPPDPRQPDYDIRADVWSLGITLVEMATGEFPYKDCKSDFEVLSRVLKDEPPSLLNYPMRFSEDFTNFVSVCLTKNYDKRPKYRKLLAHPFLQRYANTFVDVAEWYRKVVESCGMSSPALAVRNGNNSRINNPSLVSPFSRRRLTPERDKMNPSIRSTSLSPNRYYRGSDSPRKACPNEESHSSAKKIISSVVKQLVSGGSAPPSPPPRNSRNSPRFLKRSTELNQSSQNSPVHMNPFVQQHPSSNSQHLASLSRGTNPFAPSYTTHQHQLHTTGFLSQSSQVSYPVYNGSPSTVRRNLEASPCLSRRYISPSPPIPPPRRVSECNSVPGSPLTMRVKHSFTPEPTRRTLNLDL